MTTLIESTVSGTASCISRISASEATIATPPRTSGSVAATRLRKNRSESSSSSGKASISARRRSSSACTEICSSAITTPPSWTSSASSKTSSAAGATSALSASASTKPETNALWPSLAIQVGWGGPHGVRTDSIPSTSASSAPTSSTRLWPASVLAGPSTRAITVPSARTPVTSSSASLALALSLPGSWNS